MNFLTLMAPFGGRSSSPGTEDASARPADDVTPGRREDRRDGDHRSRTRPRLLPGFVPGGWKRNVVVGLGYLLGALAFFGVVRFVIELLALSGVVRFELF